MPLSCIDDAAARILDGTIASYTYDAHAAALVRQ